MNVQSAMVSQQGAPRKNLRLGLALGLFTLLYVAAVIAFLVIY